MFFIQDDRLTKGGRDLDGKEDRRNSAKKPLIMTLMTMTMTMKMKMMNTKVKMEMMMMMMIDDDDG